MKKIVIQNESCIGCGACVGIDSEHFEFSDEGFSTVKSQENLDSPALQDAIDACPVAIISLENVDESKDDATTQSHSSDEDCSCENCECHECDCQSEKSN